MELECLREVVEGIAILPGAGLRNGEKTSGSERSRSAAVSEAGLKPLHSGSQSPFRAVVGSLHALFVKETE